jgi:hypothetical protein
MRTISPLGAVIRGAIAGGVGTAAMDLFWFARTGQKLAPANLTQWEFGGPNDWDSVSVPGKVGKRLVEGFTQKPLPNHWARLMNDIMHWGYGISWGVAFGILGGSSRQFRVWTGPLFGAAVFLSDYIVLPIAGLYKPIWEYSPKDLAPDLAAHVIYGSVLAGAFAGLAALDGDD